MKAKWFWNDSINPWKNQNESWQKYDDLQNDMIELAFSQNMSHIDLGNYTVQLKHLIQYNNQNNQEQRQVKRVLQNKVVMSDREERFSFHSKKSTTFGCPHYLDLECFVHVLDSSQAFEFSQLEFTPNLLEKAAEGILEVGKILTKEKNENTYLAEANYLAKLLLSKKNESKEEIAKAVIHIYTLESFLYKEMNRALREADQTRRQISYFAKLMNYSLRHFIDKVDYKVFDGLLYRGCYLTDDQKQDYLLTFQGKHPNSYINYFTWYGYTSTTKDRAFAEKFGNTLFIISIVQTDFNYYPSPVQIEDLSQYPNEKEVLSLPCSHFKVTDIKQEKNKMIIYLTQTALGN